MGTQKSLIEVTWRNSEGGCFIAIWRKNVSIEEALLAQSGQKNSLSARTWAAFTQHCLEERGTQVLVAPLTRVIPETSYKAGTVHHPSSEATGNKYPSTISKLSLALSPLPDYNLASHVDLATGRKVCPWTVLSVLENHGSL